MPAPSARAALRLCLVTAAVASAGPARAEDAWVRGAALNLRSGPGPDHSVLAAVPAGERLEVLESKGEWTRVRRSDGTSGWIARTYLVQDGPPAARIAELEAQLAQLQQQLAGAANDAESARRDGEERAAQNAAHADQVARMRRENDALRAGARWPEWITGALILSTGIALGAAVRGVSGRRRQSRLRL